ncbi:MAG: C1 family peptidase [Dehalococcoidales bacterium]|nr:C1 family peptidase [Dehalococcoidales bacterium]
MRIFPADKASHRWNQLKGQSNLPLHNRLLAVFLSFLFVLCSVFSSSVAIDAASVNSYPIMPITQQEKALQSELFLSVPEAIIDRQIQKELQSYETGNSFNLLSHLYYVPEERNQGRIGNCWVWAGTGCMEIALNVQLGITDRLSIQYFDSLYNDGFGDDWAGNGGTAAQFADFYDAHQMIISWSNINAYYQDYNAGNNATISSEKIAENSGYLIDSVDYGLIRTHRVGEDTAITRIKNILNQDKGIFFAFYLADDEDWRQFYDFWKYEPESSIWNQGFSDGKEWNNEEGGGHAVLCVGYDDSDPDPANHYWIMLNSWGVNDGRPDGLFRVSMYNDYDDADSDGGYNSYWWTVEPDYLGAVQRGIDTLPGISGHNNPKDAVPAIW